jgi:hypothetical protein
MTTEPSISVIIPHNVTEQQFSPLLDDLRSGHIEAVIIQRKTQDFFASFDWLYTGIVISIAASFFNAIINKMGEDAWETVKNAIGKLWDKFLSSEPEIKMQRIGPLGIIKETIFCNSFSFKGGPCRAQPGLSCSWRK